MSKLSWLLLVIKQELLRGKFWAVFRYAIDSQYRKDLNILREHLHAGVRTKVHTEIALKGINFSHDINYYRWVRKLVSDIENGAELEEIKVIKIDGKYKVVDGNHRLMAYKISFGPDKKIKVRVLEKRGILTKKCYYDDKYVGKVNE